MTKKHSALYDDVISIDLGASYTKIGRRTGLHPGKYSSANTDLLVLQETVLIPSFCLQKRGGDKEWLFGVDAAKYTPLNGDVPHSNWKADLFDDPARAEYARAVQVASKFFGWLRKSLEASEIDLSKYTTRICLPELDGVEKQARVIADCMDCEGWEFPRQILKTSEPYANVLGLFTRGSNAVSKTGIPHYEGCYGSDNVLLKSIRSRSVIELHKNTSASIGVIDVGSFSTDCAILHFSLSCYEHPEDSGIEKTDAKSWKHGVISDLDDRVLAPLSAEKGIPIQSLSVLLRENMKESIYAGKSFTMDRDPVVTIGEGAEMDVIMAGICEFADKAYELCAPMIQEAAPEYVYITGGGSLIPAVRDRLRRQLVRNGTRVYDSDSAEKLTPGPDGWQVWHSTGLSSLRAATAVGAASVILDATQSRARPSTAGPLAPPHAAPFRTAALHACRCQGGNKDCCFCSGTGFRPPRTDHAGHT